jgi:thiamine biosynthesis protein ThiI
MNTYLVHYAEIGLKGRNRPEFERQLVRNIREQHSITRARRLHGRIVVHSNTELDLSDVFGIAWWTAARETEADAERIAHLAEEVAKEALAGHSTFAIRARVADKRFPLGSQELASQVGDRVRRATGLGVDLDSPDLCLYLEVAIPEAFVHTERKRGPGGLPVGTAGTLMGLFSGGIDSAAAPYLMAKRGARVELVHFYALPSAEAAHAQKIGSIARQLSRYIPHIVVHYVPYHGFELATSGLRGRDRRHELVVFRRYMACVAQRIARERGALGIFSGDSLGQVASQTLENLAAVSQGLDLPMYRPLIGYDKLEIVRLAKRIGVFPLATQEYKDCCSIIARNPSTRAHLEVVQRIEAQLDLETLTRQALAETTSYSYADPAHEGAPFVPFEGLLEGPGARGPS